MGWIGDYSDLS
ncbi:hypothetical protein HU200_065641 [Digitaria exilis]|uniref:Uncharacterized protein n=1 Tax=Digitaria exilis TaxID=1010633 RepID=A0A835A3P4_9POAL|nr:hypothetical protein HU200_065641 [Digitaria exilis]